MNRKPKPLIAIPERKHCPICGKVSYSADGVHPQCSMQQADEKRMKRLKRTAKTRKPAQSKSDLRPWQKRCPKCRTAVHCRKAACECGHKFLATPTVCES